MAPRDEDEFDTYSSRELLAVARTILPHVKRSLRIAVMAKLVPYERELAANGGHYLGERSHKQLKRLCEQLPRPKS